MVIDNPLSIKHGSPLPSSYYALNALIAILRDQFCYCPHFIEVEIGTQGVKPHIQGYSASKQWN